MVKLSMIIPVYNVENYLCECLDSILVQDFKDYEIILVNDGSTDCSGKICEEYSRKYSFVKLIHKKNGGLSDARNTGLDKANGEYIWFIDSDDYIFDNAISNIIETVYENPNVDVVFIDALKKFPNSNYYPLDEEYSKDRISRQTQLNVLEYLTTLKKFPGSACTKVVKRILIKDNNISFEKNLLSEDIDWTLQILVSASSFNYCNFPCYCYRQLREGSITNTVDSKNVVSLLSIIEKWAYKTDHNRNEFQLYLNLFMTYEYIILLLLYKSLHKSDKKVLKKEITNYSWLLSISKDKRIILLNIIYRIFNLDMVSIILFYYQKLKSLILKINIDM